MRSGHHNIWRKGQASSYQHPNAPHHQENCEKLFEAAIEGLEGRVGINRDTGAQLFQFYVNPAAITVLIQRNRYKQYIQATIDKRMPYF